MGRPALVEEVRAALAAVAVPADAAPMQAYMKSDLPFLGVRRPALRVALRPVLRGLVVDRAAWEAAVRSLVHEATHREEWYAAAVLLRHRVARGWRDASVLPLVREVVEATAWWDVVDEVAAHVVGAALAADRDAVTPVLREWAVDDDLWVRRTAILAQLRAKEATDTELLDDVLVPSLGSSEFFLRKAIGWALRAHAYTDPDWVRAWVAAHDDELSGLSRREALKHL